MSRTTSEGRRPWHLVLAACTLLFLAAPASAQYPDFRFIASAAAVDGPTHDGVELQIDLPPSEHVKNFGAPADQKGLCVFTSITMDARWHHVRELVDLTYWDKDGQPHSKVKEGGGYPDKVDAVLKLHAPNLKYVQYEGTDPAVLDKALSSGRGACVTYGYGERYGMETIYHMVLLVHLDDKRAAILDNNFPGTYEWMPRDEFLRRWVHPSGQGWAVVFIAPPPPPVPHN